MAKDPRELLSAVLNPRTKLRSVVAVVLFFVAFVWLAHPSLPSLAGYQVNSNPVFNSTLGFARILGVVIPGSDRKDTLLAAGSAANIDISIFDAVLPEQIEKAEIPKNWGNDGYKPVPGVLGCLTSHLRIWRKMIDENIASVLIMESDADFDLRIRESMLGLSEGSKAIIAEWAGSTPDQTHTHSPYGDDWDILWIGHCGANNNGGKDGFAFEDESAADDVHAWAPYAKFAEGYQRANGTRLVFQLRDVVCTVAYAISNQGARKMEKLFQNVNQPVDLEMLRQCTKDNTELICISTFPQIISMVEALPSSIDGGKDKTKDTISDQDPSVGQGVQISARKNAAQGTAGRGPKHWIKEWSN